MLLFVWIYWFRCLGTFCNYLGYLRGACHAIGVDAPPTGHAALRRAMVAIAKRQMFTTKEKHFIRRYRPACRSTMWPPFILLTECRPCVKELVREGLGQPSFSFSMLWLLAYTFMLRVPSEACGFRFLYMCAHNL